MDDARPLVLAPLFIPAGITVDGSVAALAQEPDGTITAEICIPGPAVP